MEEVTTFLAMNGKPVQINGWFFNRDYWKKPLTLTLETDGHGTLTANTVTGYAGDTVELTTAYNTYYRFSGYDVTGGTIDGNTFTFGDEDATVYAVFKPNAFTAVGKFSGFTYNYNSTAYPPPGKVFNGILTGFTGSKPSNWPANNSNWNVTNASAYAISATTKLQVKHTKGANAVIVSAKICIGTTAKTSVATSTKNSMGPNTTYDLFTLNMSTNSTQGQINYSASLYAAARPTSFILGTNNWRATGYAP